MSKNKNNGSSNSLRGKWGKVGAPPKPVKFPVGPFTMARLVAMNVKGKYEQCVLSLRTKLSDGLAAGEIICLKPKKQPKGAVGRPAPVYVLKDNYDASTMVVWTPPTKPIRKAKAEVAVSETPMAPAISVPVVEVVPATVETVTSEVVPATAPEVTIAPTVEAVSPTAVEAVVA